VEGKTIKDKTDSILKIYTNVVSKHNLKERARGSSTVSRAGPRVGTFLEEEWRNHRVLRTVGHV